MPTKDNINSTYGNNPVTVSDVDLFQTGVPVGLVSNGTVATAGTIALGTAMSRTMLGMWIHLPAGAVVGGAQGFYWCVFTSTTAGQVYTNYAADGALVPFVPSGTLVAAVGSNVAYTSITGADIVAAAGTVPGGFMGKAGFILAEAFSEYNNSAGAKIARVKYDTAAFVDLSTTTSLSQGFSRYLWNRGDVTQQMSQPAATLGHGNSSAAAFTSNINSLVDKSLTYVLQKAVATDWIIVSFMHANVVYSD